jgi:hypothetical protein
MAEEPKLHSWWQTLPGILTATAGIITALTGLLVVLYNAGVFEPDAKDRPSTYTASPVTEPDANPAQPGTTPDQPAGQVAQSSVQEQAAKTPATKAAGAARRINLLAPENGGQLLVATNDHWTATIDGKEDYEAIYSYTGEAVYGFKDDRAATFDTFTMLIGKTVDTNVKEFELLAGNDTPTGTFEPIGKFQPQNIKLFRTPYQEFRFPPVTARYLKIKVLSAYGESVYPIVWEFQLFGSLK